MPISVSFMRKLDGVSPEIREVLLSLMEEVEQSREEAVTKIEFNELREIVRELAEAQKKTEQTVSELAQAQKRTEQTVNELAQAQKRTEEEVRKLTIEHRRTRQQVGGLSRSVAYALENEAYRNLPPFLKEKHGIEMVDRIIRFELNGEEVNLFARAKRNGEEIVLVGEAVLRLDDKGKLKKIKKKADMVSDKYGMKVSPIVVTHFATSKLMKEAKKAGFLVVQSFEW